MAKDVKELSTETLKKRVKAAIVILVICWAAVVASIVISLIRGASPFTLASSTGFLGLAVASIAMGIGVKTAK